MLLAALFLNCAKRCQVIVVNNRKKTGLVARAEKRTRNNKDPDIEIEGKRQTMNEM